MGFLRDWTFIEDATRIPALSEMIREALIRAIFVRDDRVLTREIVGDLTRTPAVTIKVKDDGEIRKVVQVVNGEEGTMTLGLSAEDYHYFRKALGVGRDREIGLVVRPKILLTYDWLVPEQRGIQLDFSAYSNVEFSEAAHRAIAQVGASWKQVYDAALAKGHLLPFVPTVPLGFTIGDAFWGEAPFASYEGDFGSYVMALRTVSSYGHRTRIGFDEVANHGSGYDLLHGILRHADEFFIPVAVSFRLAPKPAARKTLTYVFDDGAKLASALDKLTRSGRSLDWVHVTDATASTVLRQGTPPEAFTVQVSIAGSSTGLAAREKALDTLLAGFKSKAADLPNPFDLPADAYRRAAERAGQSVFVGEVRLPVRAFADFAGQLKAFGEQSAARVGLYASVRNTGIVSAFPAFDSARERPRIYELSKGVQQVTKKVPGSVFVSRLSHLWRQDDDYLRRVDLFRRLKLEIDSAHVVQPLVRF